MDDAIKGGAAAMLEERLESKGGVGVFIRSWRPAGQARGVVVIVPGFNAHGGYYLWVADRLTALGLAVYAVDLRGRGKSDGERFYVRSITDYVADVAVTVDTARARTPGLPVFMLGHSAGGVVACLYTLDHQAELAGLICESFAFQVPAPDFALAVFKGLSHVWPHAHVLHLNNAFFSRDPVVVAAMDADPLIAHEAQPTQTLAELVRADETLKKSFPSMTLPLLIMHGTADKATRPAGSQLFFDTAGAADKTLKLYAGGFHDLLNDLDKETAMADIAAWLDSHL
jgi:acylglycerol lipase